MWVTTWTLDAKTNLEAANAGKYQMKKTVLGFTYVI